MSQRSPGGRCRAAGADRRLLDEGDVAPGVGTEAPGVVVGLRQEVQSVGRDVVPLLARDLAGLAADAHVVSVKKPMRTALMVVAAAR